jgi:class 3 adenylate cyclase
MRGLTRADVWLLATLVPLWVICTILHVDRQTSERPIAWFPLYVEGSASANGYPLALRPWSSAEIGQQDVQAGDVLLSMGDQDLRGRSRIFVMTRAYDEALEGRVPFHVRRDGRERDAGVTLANVPNAWSHLLVSTFMGLFATLILIRGRGSRSARACAAAALVFSLHFCSLYGGSPALHQFSLVLIIATGALYPPLMLRAGLLFPPSQAPQSERILLVPWILVITGPALYIWLFGVPSLGLFDFGYASACFSTGIASLLFVLVRNYGRADARGRRQMNWGLFGFFIATIPPLVASLLVARDPSLRWIYESSLVFQIFLPIFIFIALVRDNLFDINRLITTTIGLALLAPIGLGLAVELGPLATEWLSDATHLQASTTRWVLVFGAALVVIVPGHMLRDPIESWLFREEFQFERALKTMPLDAGDAQGSGTLLGHFGERLAALEVFETSAIFSRVGDAFVPVTAHGPLVPPAFAASGPLPAMLEAGRGPLLARGWRRLAKHGALPAQETAQLEGLCAEVLLPLFRDEELVAFLILGPKRSGDVYSRAEIALLEGLAGRMGLELEKHDHDALIAEERALHEELARYAPGSIVEELTRGGDRASGEREVTVLFVDIRGYSKMSRKRASPEIFDLINKYTLNVSRRVRDHGGSIVEFHGDGLMAAFGAAAPLDEKERCAVATARAIVKDINAGAIDSAADEPIRVGIGIATGLAFVGDIQSIDRKIWAVIGETTNLAARLESLTRDLGVVIAIDTATHERLGEASEGFELNEGMRVKGWEEPIRVWSSVHQAVEKVAAA